MFDRLSPHEVPGGSTRSHAVFVKVAEQQSFSRAAQQLGIPKATATTAVQELEEVVRARLLHRTTRTVSLTSEGAAYLERCKDLLSDLDELESMFQIGAAELRGKVRVDMTARSRKTW